MTTDKAVETGASTDRAARLQERLQEQRFRHAAARVRTRLEAMGENLGDYSLLDRTQTQAAWGPWLERLNDAMPDASARPAHERDVVADHLATIVKAYGGRPALWFVRDPEADLVVAVRVAFPELLIARALREIISRQADLMLGSERGDGGLMVELHRGTHDDVCEVVCWGAFRPG